MRNLTGLFFALALLISSLAQAQIVYEPLHRDVYNFLTRTAAKGIVRLDDELRPLPRWYVAAKLRELSEQPERLTPLEREELAFFLRDYAHENRRADSTVLRAPETVWFRHDSGGRFRPFSYADNRFQIAVQPLIGVTGFTRQGEFNHHRWNGAQLYGYWGKHIGFSFDFRDNHEAGPTIDRTKALVPTTGVIGRTASSNRQSIDYSEARGSLAFSWRDFSVVVGKELLEWGYGESGKLVQSQRAPSYPFFRIDARLTPWLRFNYTHAFLNSMVLDSAASYPTGNAVGSGQREFFRSKFLAQHSLFITPLKGLSVAIGESIVYSDRLEPAYLIPILFFRLSDHALGGLKNNDVGNNAQIFMQVSSRNHIPRTHLYANLFVDELRLLHLSNPAKRKNQVGYLAGASVVDFPVKNLVLTAEYTRINPFVYAHYIPAQTYANSNYSLGHWLGNNGDLLYGSALYRLARGLQLRGYASMLRKGEGGTVEQQYRVPQPPFLFGLNRSRSQVGASLRYEFIHDLFLQAQVEHERFTTETRRDTYVTTTDTRFSVSVNYGF
jgi:hypothetical protein